MARTLYFLWLMRLLFPKKKCVKVPEIKTYVPSIPVSQRLKRKAIDEYYQKIVEMLKKLQVNMSFLKFLLIYLLM